MNGGGGWLEDAVMSLLGDEDLGMHHLSQRAQMRAGREGVIIVRRGGWRGGGGSDLRGIGAASLGEPAPGRPTLSSIMLRRAIRQLRARPPHRRWHCDDPAAPGAKMCGMRRRSILARAQVARARHHPFPPLARAQRAPLLCGQDGRFHRRVSACGFQPFARRAAWRRAAGGRLRVQPRLLDVPRDPLARARALAAAGLRRGGGHA